MSSAAGIRAGRAFVEVGTYLAPLQQGLSRAEGLVKGFGSRLSGLGSAIFAPLAVAGIGGLGAVAALGSQIGEIGGAIDDAAQRTGLSTEAISELGHAAEMAGADLPTLEAGLVKMQRTLAAAGAGSKGAAAAFEALGLSQAQLAGMSQDQQFAAIADKIASIEDPAQRTAAAMSIFGKAGQKLLPVLNGGAKGIETFRQQARDLGKSMSGEDAAAAADLGDSVENLHAAFKAAGFNLVVALAPALTEVFSLIGQSVGFVSRLIKEYRGWIIAGFAVAGGVLAIGAALMLAGGIFSAVGVIIGGVSAAISFLAGVVGFLLSPIGLALTAVAGLTAYFVLFTETGQAALGQLTEAWQTFAGEATGAWGAITAAVGAGDLTAAFAVGTSFLQVQWLRVTSFLEDAWLTATDGLMGAWDVVSGWLAQGFVTIGDALTTAWSATTDFVIDTFDSLLTGLYGVWAKFQSWLAQGFAWIAAKAGGGDAAAAMEEVKAGFDREQQQRTAAFDKRAKDRADARAQRDQTQATTTADMRAAIDDGTAARAAQRAARRKSIDERQAAELAQAQANFSAALANANALGQQRRNKLVEEKGPPIAAAAAAAVASSQRATAVDVRSSEGLKAVLDLVTRSGRDDAQEEIAANTEDTAEATAELADNSGKQLTTMQDIYGLLSGVGDLPA